VATDFLYGSYFQWFELFQRRWTADGDFFAYVMGEQEEIRNLCRKKSD
jgi:hypothetical protein